MIRRTIPCLLAVGLLTGLGACAPAEAPDTRAADEAAIREIEVKFSAAAGAKDLDTIMSFYADDAVIMPEGLPTGTGKDAIRKNWEGLLATPGMTSLGWQTSSVVVARSGDIAYSTGNTQMGLSGPDGASITIAGKYVTTWHKHADGSWKAAVDIFNSDVPVAAPAPAAAGSGS